MFFVAAQIKDGGYAHNDCLLEGTLHIMRNVNMAIDQARKERASFAIRYR